MSALCLLALPLLALSGSAVSWADTLQIEVVVGMEARPAGSLRVRGQWLDQPFDQALHDSGDGSAPTGDGIWSTTLSGPATRMVQLELVSTTSGSTPTVLASTTETVSDSDTLTWALPTGSPPRATRVALARPARQLEQFETATTIAGLGWFALTFGYVVWLVDGRFNRTEPRRRRRRNRP